MKGKKPPSINMKLNISKSQIFFKIFIFKKKFFETNYGMNEFICTTHTFICWGLPIFSMFQVFVFCRRWQPFCCWLLGPQINFVTHIHNNRQYKYVINIHQVYTVASRSECNN